MAIGRPGTIDDAPAVGVPSRPDGAQGRSAAEDDGGETFLPREEWANRGPRGACPVGWKAQGKKVDPTALRLRRSRRSRSSARSSQGEARCSRALNSILGRRRGGHRLPRTRGRQRSGVEKESLAQKRDASHPDQTRNDDARYDAPIAAGREGRNGSALRGPRRSVLGRADGRRHSIPPKWRRRRVGLLHPCLLVAVDPRLSRRHRANVSGSGRGGHRRHANERRSTDEDRADDQRTLRASSPRARRFEPEPSVAW